MRIVTTGTPDCAGGLVIGAGTTDTLVANSVIHGNHGDGIRILPGAGGPHWLIGTTLHGNRGSGLRVGAGANVRLVNSLVTGNGAPGVQHDAPTGTAPQAVQLLQTLACGNATSELQGPLLDAADAGTLTPTGTEGPGVSARPGCEDPAQVYAALAGPDGLVGTLDDEFTPAVASPALDAGLDPRTLGLDPALDASLRADYARPLARPSGSATPLLFDLGALERVPDAPIHSATLPVAPVGSPGTAPLAEGLSGPAGGLDGGETLLMGEGGPPVPNLVGAYAMNEVTGAVAADGSGSANAGTITGATRTTSGKYGSGLSFDGANDWVTIAGSESLDLTTGMTLEAWVYPTAASGWRTLLLKEAPTGLAYALYLQDGKPAVYVNLGAYDEGKVATASIPLNAWSHVAATYDGSTLRLYVNGSSAGSRSLPGALTVAPDHPLRLGGNSAWGEYFQGRLDEIRVYNRALTQTEIQADKDAPFESAPVAPAPPTSLTATVVAWNQVTLTWTDASLDETGFELAWGLEGQPETGRLLVGPDVTTYPVVNLQGETPYVFRVRAFNGAGTSADSPTASARTPVQPTSIPGLVAAYGFTAGSGPLAADTSGSGNTATLRNGAQWTAEGKYGPGLLLDGLAAWASVADAASLDLAGAMTLAAWVYPTVPPTDWRTVLLKAHPPGQLVYGLYASGGSTNVPSGHVFTSENWPLNTDTATAGTAQLPANTWTHLAATYDGSTLALYVNGVLASSRPWTGTLVTTGARLGLGGNSEWGEHFQGTLDEVRVYNRALTQPELQAAMAAPLLDAAAPDTTITAAPPDPSTSADATFEFTATPPGGTFACRVDGAEFAPCTSPKSYTGLAAGPHTFEVRAADAAGTPDPTPAGHTWTITLTPPPTITGFSPAAGQAGTTVTITGANLDTTTQVAFNGVTAAFTVLSASQLTATAPSGVTTGPLTVTTLGGTAASLVSFTVLVPPVLTITSPSNGATIGATSTEVRGTISGGATEVGVVVNGAAAFVSGSQWITQVPLVAGTNAITVTATDGFGASSSSSVTVQVSQPQEPALVLTARPASGIAPLTVRFNLEVGLGRPIVRYDFDTNGDGTADITSATFENVAITYTTPGLFTPTLTATDDLGATFVVATAVQVLDTASTVAMLTSKWDALKAALGRADVEAALQTVAGGVRDRYRSALEALGADLVALAAQLGDLQVLSVENGLAETVTVRLEDGERRLYFIYLVPDDDGIWRILGM